MVCDNDIYFEFVRTGNRHDIRDPAINRNEECCSDVVSFFNSGEIKSISFFMPVRNIVRKIFISYLFEKIMDKLKRAEDKESAVKKVYADLLKQKSALQGKIAQHTKEQRQAKRGNRRSSASSRSGDDSPFGDDEEY